jgi:uncharacterized protein with FMN-binding domain
MTTSTQNDSDPDMSTEPREPSRLPVRGTIAAAGTVGALALLLSFRGGPLAPTGHASAAEDAALATDELIAADAATGTTGGEVVVEPVTYTGDVVRIRWGDVQVKATLDGADITEVVALQMPDSDHHTSNISDYVEPILRDEAIAIDSADVSVISGATYTSKAYAASLQSALDQAEFAAAGEETAAAVEPQVASEASSDVVADEPTTTGVRTATGDPIAIRWGDVQVAVTADGDDIVDVETLSVPMDDRQSQRINSSAAPILREEAIAADSADVSVISGATYTSEAYAASLQSALDQLGI